MGLEEQGRRRGGTGFIGRALGTLLHKKGYQVINISRMPGPMNIVWDELEYRGLPPSTAVVSLAGQNILDPKRRWTPGFKQNVWNSRVNTTSSLAKAIAKAPEKPKVFVSISGVGIYPPSSTAEYTEDTPTQPTDFLSELAIAWEGAAKLPPEAGVRQVILRSGVVLGRFGGMVQQLYLPFFFGVGGPISPGTQYLPWIYIDDIAKMIQFSIENEKVSGVLNGVAPQVITNKDFTSAFAKAMWRPALIPVPKFALDLAFGSERAKIMTEGQKVIPKRALEYGFKYDYPDIDSACRKCARLFDDFGLK
ncbi:epimerase family protein SDR39U1 isoform X1 [Thrips palmi]|uniref:Epimerase family protein SDR39U1 isoform X1 n=1 Tax=Thrips palmi TaxID=161013 RepID=A0A6P8ZLH1_THRPL|nr:epimerase family protein SDR39U1 isoform X1 [Thrips palmi]